MGPRCQNGRRRVEWAQNCRRQKQVGRPSTGVDNNVRKNTMVVWRGRKGTVWHRVLTSQAVW